MQPTPYFVHIFMDCNRQIYPCSSDNVSLNTYITLLATKNWEESEGNTAICMLTVADSEHTCHKRRREGPATATTPIDGCWQVVTALMGMLMARGCAERGRAAGRTVTAVPTISYSVGVQRSRGSSSRVRKTEKNLAYQPARDPLIWAAYMPRNVGPLGALLGGFDGTCKQV
jgi:hypothetical protein